MKTSIPLTEYNRIRQTKSSPETIVSLLNEAENLHFAGQRNYNRKRIYPFWKVCQTCQKPFMAITREQAVRNKDCKECVKVKMGKWNKGKRQKKIICPVCKKEFYPTGQSKGKPRKYCSEQCNGKERAKTLIKYSGNGKGKKRPGTGLSGKENPAWKGGVTYFRKHGNYAPIKYVRCPKEYLTMSRKDGYVMEHRLVMAQSLDRNLLRKEVVHHINHNPQDNRIENLMLFPTNKAHKIYEGQEQR